jgi:hypothetical protein
LAKDLGEPRKSDLENVLKQLKSISEARNSVVHWIPVSDVKTASFHSPASLTM